METGDTERAPGPTGSARYGSWGKTRLRRGMSGVDSDDARPTETEDSPKEGSNGRTRLVRFRLMWLFVVLHDLSMANGHRSGAVPACQTCAKAAARPRRLRYRQDFRRRRCRLRRWIALSKVKIGTASWTDKPLIDSHAFYPDGCTSAEARLRFYAENFPMVEVDSTYYGMPSERNSNLWIERTPDGFTFNVKAFRLFTTHRTPPKALPVDVRNALPGGPGATQGLYYRDVPPDLRDLAWEMFASALAPLHTAGKLGVVVFQFPPWFMPRQASYSHIEECKRRLPEYDVAVEFRNRYWLDGDNLEKTLGFLRYNEISYIAVDEPQGFESSVPPLADVTGPYGLVRFHGRNRSTWEKKGLKSSSERFDYYYTREEIEEWVPKIDVMRQGVEELHLVVNTNNWDQGVVNARLLGDVLGG